VIALVFNGINQLLVFDLNGVILWAEGAAGIVALFLGCGDLAVQAAQEINQL